MTETDIANLALAKLGATMIASLESTTTKEAIHARLHYAAARDQVLADHPWRFANKFASLNQGDTGPVYASLTTGSGNASILWTAANPGLGGNDLGIIFSDFPFDGIAFATAGSTLTVRLVANAVCSFDTPTNDRTLLHAGFSNDGRPRWSDQGWWGGGIAAILHSTGTAWFYEESLGDNQAMSTADVDTPDLIPTGAYDEDTNPHAWQVLSGEAPSVILSWTTTAAEVVTAAAASTLALSLVAAAMPDGTDGSGTISPASSQSLTGGDVGIYSPMWDYAFFLPSDCVCLRAVFDEDRDPIDKFERGTSNDGQLVFTNHSAPLIARYTSRVTATAQFPPLFVDALSTLLAAKMARAITGSDQLESALLSAYLTAILPEARFRDAQETASGENRDELRDMLLGDLLPRRGPYIHPVTIPPQE